MVRISGAAVGLAPRRAVGLDDLDMGAEPARLTRAAGEIPARGGAVAAGNGLHLVGDRAPGEDAGRPLKISLRRVGVEIGRGHGADRALAEAPGGRGIGLGHFLEHLHEDLGRRLGAAEALRQQRAIEPVLDQGGNHRLGEPPRPLDLVGLLRDQRRQRPRALDQSEAGKLVHAFPRPFWVFWLAKPQWWSIRRRRSRWGWSMGGVRIRGCAFQNAATSC